ncbi:hypothetical protein H1V43_22210 [Streptomyces sp. PSKA54]|uniref:Uncharacterized protein n=1 Tax=Streptomyces himalayensis subsp. aureolus TaxID=2758039 RepID=A0A7W2D3F0_9ACTN|nr:hypothetical protein [Streptomyces himalayensis]MBA4864021.1 hypothetical protein [Streptomyces himalayensis subsp. aureolus]
MKVRIKLPRGALSPCPGVAECLLGLPGVELGTLHPKLGDQALPDLVEGAGPCDVTTGVCSAGHG